MMSPATQALSKGAQGVGIGKLVTHSSVLGDLCSHWPVQSLRQIGNVGFAEFLDNVRVGRSSAGSSRVQSRD